MKQIWKKLGTVFLILCLVLTLLPVTALAADANSLKSTIENYEGKELTATLSEDGKTVTVEGTVTDASSPLQLNIDEGVKVVWEASITAAADFTQNLINVSGNGTFEVASGEITANEGFAIFGACDLTITGGTVTSASQHETIYVNASNLTVSGGTIRTTYASNNDGAAAVKTAANTTATFSGNCQVEATGDAFNAAVDAEGDVEVENDAHINAVKGIAIKTAGNVTVSGGTVSSGTYSAISATGINSVVTVSGGTVSNSAASDEYSVIYMKNTNNTSENVTVSGGQVLAQWESGSTACAIKTSGSVAVSGGEVSATTGTAIYADGDSSTVTVSGGSVSNSATVSENPVIYMDNAANTAKNVTIDAGGTVQATGTGEVAVRTYGSVTVNGTTNGKITYSVTVKSGTANPEFAAENDFVEITAAPPLFGQHFAGWQVVSGNITPASQQANTTFTMPASTVELTATYNDITIDVSDAGELKTALVIDVPRSINVTADITMTEQIEVGANHTLNIPDGNTLSTGADGQLYIGANKTLTLTGTGTLKINNTNDNSSGAQVYGTLKSNGTGINVENSTGINSTGILLTSGAQMLVHGGTLTVNNSTCTGIGGLGTMTMEGGCSVTVSNTGESTKGIDIISTTVKDSTVLIDSDYIGINYSMSFDNSTVTIARAGYAGLNIITALNMSDSTINVNNVAGENDGDYGLYFDGAPTISADQNSKITLSEGAKLFGANHKFSDWGTVLNSHINTVTVGAADATVTANGLSAGDYVWNGTHFAKGTYYTVTFNLNGGNLTGGELTQTILIGGTATAPTVTRSGYTFDGWDKAFSNVTQNLTVTAKWRSNSSNDHHSSGGSLNTTPSATVSGSTATTTVKTKIGLDGNASASVTKSQVNGAIKAAQKAATKTGEAPRVKIQVAGVNDASTVETTLPKSAIQALVTGEMESLTLSGPVADMTFDAQAIAAISDAASGDVSFTSSQLKTSDLSDAAQQVVGNRPVYDFSVTSGGKTITQFDGTVTVSIPYTPAAGEDVNAIVAYYVNADGEPELMQNCQYDAETGSLIFITNHFSQYAVGYNKVNFNDVSDSAWYAEAVSYLAARGISGGTSETTFSPDATLTRGQFITLLLRAYSIEPDYNSNDNFSDAGNTYYTDYLATAKRMGITDGVGDNNFAPEQAISRQQMFTLLYNALKVIDQLPAVDSGKKLSDFSDKGSVSSYAQESMTYLVKTGVVSGNNGLLLPKANTTRAQMSQVLYKLLAK